MIDLIYHSENAFIYNADDWEKVRKEHRCIGELFGHTPHFHRQAILPLQLSPEEALLLVEKQIGRLVSYQEKQTTKEEHEQFKQDLFKAEKKYYIEKKSKLIEIHRHKIIAGKRKKGDMRPENEILNEEIAKGVPQPNKMIWPLCREKFDKSTAQIIDADILWKQTTPIKYKTFKDFWERKFYITSGLKFGGDYIVYPGDPLVYHSQYIVRCMKEDEKIHATELVVMGRCSTQVKKKGVLSYLHNGKVNYITINWLGK